MITQKEVEYIAKLARLGLTQDEIKEFQKKLSPILDYFEKMKEVDVSRVKPISHSIEIRNITREDEEDEESGKKIAKKLLELAPKTENGYIKVKSVF